MLWQSARSCCWVWCEKVSWYCKRKTKNNKDSDAHGTRSWGVGRWKKGLQTARWNICVVVVVVVPPRSWARLSLSCKNMELERDSVPWQGKGSNAHGPFCSWPLPPFANRYDWCWQELLNNCRIPSWCQIEFWAPWSTSLSTCFCFCLNSGTGMSPMATHRKFAEGEAWDKTEMSLDLRLDVA